MFSRFNSTYFSEYFLFSYLSVFEKINIQILYKIKNLPWQSLYDFATRDKITGRIRAGIRWATLTSSHSSIRYTRPVWELEYGFLSEYFCMPLSYVPCPLPLPKTEILHPTLIFILRMDTISNYFKYQILNWSQLQYCRIVESISLRQPM